MLKYQLDQSYIKKSMFYHYLPNYIYILFILLLITKMSLSDFKILDKIGEGAYSSVHKAKRISDGKDYALKKVRLTTLKEKQKENSLNQVRLLASIDSQYIISYRDAFIDDNGSSLYLIMQYADGGDLQQKINSLIKNHNRMPQNEIWKLISNLLNGLVVLHNMNILHRDLKCANIFISGGLYKLGDLNVSKILKKGLAYTQTGTPYYASPEVWRDQPYDNKSDIWSLGCVIYQVCTLKPPFQAKDMEGLYKKVQKGVFERIPRIYSNQLQKFIQLCLQLNPNKRPYCRQLLNFPMFNKEKQNQSERQNNLLQTIRVPRNLKTLKEKLPKSKYQIHDTGSDIQRRLPTDKIDSKNRYRTDSSCLLSQNHVILPSIKKSPDEGQYLNRHRIYTNKQKNKNSYQKQYDGQKIQDMIKQKQKLKQLIELKQKRLLNNNLYDNNVSRNRIVKILPHPLSYEKQHKVEQYSRPSWWG